jgi:hypothetical protein
VILKSGEFGLFGSGGFSFDGRQNKNNKTLLSLSVVRKVSNSKRQIIWIMARGLLLLACSQQQDVASGTINE